MPEKSQSIGEWGEEVAENHLRKLGFQILERNWHASHAEVDRIAMDGEVLVFVEVKTIHIRQAEVENIVSKAQRARIANAASIYMDEINHDWEIRFDLLEVKYHDRDNYSIRHIKDFFYPMWEI